MKQKFTGSRLPTPFQGEMMVCYLCRKKKRSNPTVESGWTTFDIEGTTRIYVCPKCFPKFIKSTEKL